MKMPRSAPDFGELLAEMAGTPQLLVDLISSGEPVDAKGRYLHWDDLRRRTPPEGLNHSQWWLRMAATRRSSSRALPLRAVDGNVFTFSNIDRVQEVLHRIDQQASGQILADGDVMGLRSSDRYLVSSLVEEAITSSQLEGASTTRRVAKEMLETGRRPRDRSERMIVNNFNALLATEELAAEDRPLTMSDILDLHRVITTDALDDERDAGRLQTSDDSRVAVYYRDMLVHEPPPASELPDRLDALVRFANSELGDGFVHPVVRAIVLHFWLAYDHPFADGNGRTARSLFYWSMLRSGYWLAQYVSISSVLRQAPAQYAKSYLHVETDHNDLTYFIVHQLSVIEMAIENLRGYLARKMVEARELQSLLHSGNTLNHRQLAIVGDAIRDAQEPFTIQAQARRHRVTYQSARTDLLGLEELGLFNKTRIGKKFVFRSVPDLTARLRVLESD